MSEQSILTPDFKETPYWWEEAPRPASRPDPLPASADVVVVGSGYTGLNAALTLARRGRTVLVLDAEDLGRGASSRNVGSMGRTFRHSFADLYDTRGVDFATKIYTEIHAAFDFAFNRIESEGINCYLNRRGRFTAFIAPKQYDEGARELDLKRKHIANFKDYLVPREEQGQEIGFGHDLYFGGIVLPDVASIHPGLYHLGLLARVQAAGVTTIGGTAVLDVRRDGKEFTVLTSRGTVKARDVIVATNGYTGGMMRYVQRRVFPFPAYVMATEPIGEERIKRLITHFRNVQEKAENPFFLRPTPDLTRLIVGGRAGTFVTSVPRFAKTLHRLLVARIPDLASVKIAHLWTGKCSGTFSVFPGIGVHDGVHYAMGYCFSGIAMGTYLGTKIGLRVAGDPESATVFDSINFETRFWHQGYPWFVPFAAEMMLSQDRKIAVNVPI